MQLRNAAKKCRFGCSPKRLYYIQIRSGLLTFQAGVAALRRQAQARIDHAQAQTRQDVGGDGSRHRLGSSRVLVTEQGSLTTQAKSFATHQPTRAAAAQGRHRIAIVSAAGVAGQFLGTSAECRTEEVLLEQKEKVDEKSCNMALMPSYCRLVRCHKNAISCPGA